MWRFAPNTTPQGHGKSFSRFRPYRTSHFECPGPPGNRLADSLPFGKWMSARVGLEVLTCSITVIAIMKDCRSVDALQSWGWSMEIRTVTSCNRIEPFYRRDADAAGKAGNAKHRRLVPSISVSSTSRCNIMLIGHRHGLSGRIHAAFSKFGRC